MSKAKTILGIGIGVVGGIASAIASIVNYKNGKANQLAADKDALDAYGAAGIDETAETAEPVTAEIVDNTEE